MFCQNCGKEIPQETKFCPFCGEPVDDTVNETVQQKTMVHSQILVQQSSEKVSLRKKENRKGIIAIIAGVVLILIAIVAFLPNTDVSIVKDGHFQNFSNITVGKAFDNFFADTEWKAVAVGNDHYVYFSGDCSSNDTGKKEKLYAKFIVHPKTNTFELIHLEINTHDISEEIPSIVQQICSGKKQIAYQYRLYR